MVKIHVLEAQDTSILKNVLGWSRPKEQVSISRCKTILSDPRILILVAIREQMPVGIIIGYVLPRLHGDVMFLYEIDVHTDFRRNGIATKMIEHLKGRCLERKISEIFVFTNAANKGAMGLYERTGGNR